MSWVATGVAVAGAATQAYSASQAKKGGGKSTSKSKGMSESTTTGSSSSQITLMDQANKQILDKITGGLADKVTNAKDFDKQAAAADAEGVVKSIFDSYQKTALPEIANMANRGGSYDSTAQQLMANDAYATAVNKASSTVLDTIMKEQAMKNDVDQADVDALLGSLGLQAQVVQRSENQSTQTTKGSTKGSAEGTQASESSGNTNAQWAGVAISGYNAYQKNKVI